MWWPLAGVLAYPLGEGGGSLRLPPGVHQPTGAARTQITCRAPGTSHTSINIVSTNNEGIVPASITDCCHPTATHGMNLIIA